MSIKLSPHYTFLENILVEGKARNKHRPNNDRKSSYKPSQVPPPSDEIQIAVEFYLFIQTSESL